MAIQNHLSRTGALHFGRKLIEEIPFRFYRNN